MMLFDKMVAVQDKLADLEDPQVELYLLRSYIGVCKVISVVCHLPLWAPSLILSYKNALVGLCIVAFLIVLGHEPLCRFDWEVWPYVTHSILLLHPSYIGSCDSVHVLVSCLVGTLYHFLERIAPSKILLCLCPVLHLRMISKLLWMIYFLNNW